MRKWIWVAGVLTACSSETAPPPEEGPVVGSFRVRLAAEATSILGKIYDGPTPQAIVWEEKAAAGSCKLLEPRVPFCNTPCGGSAVCVEDDVCQPYPAAHSAGTVTVRGLGPEFSMKPVANNYQAPPDVTLVPPPEGSAIEFSAAGEYYEAFTLSADGILPLELPETAPSLERGRALTLTWPAAEVSTISVRLDISHHGGSKGKIECSAADSGSIELAPSLVDRLLDLGAAGFPSVIVSRAAVGSTAIAQGRVTLEISSDVERPVSVPGITSCTADEQCPMGQACRTDLTCG